MQNFVRSIAAAALFSGLVVLSAPAAAQSSPVLGSWDTVAETPMGEMKSTITFAQQGGAFMVDIKDAPMAGPGGAPAGAAPESTISEVKVDGAAFSFKRALQTPQGAINLTYSGTVSDNALTGEASSEFGAVPIKGTRTGG